MPSTAEARAKRRRLERLKDPERYWIPAPAPSGLLAPWAWSVRRKGTPPGAFRNHRCPKYDQCLDAAARHELNFSCGCCEHEQARQPFRPDYGDLAGSVGLLLVVAAGCECPNPAGVVARVADRLGEFLSFIAGEQPRFIDEPYRLAAE